MERNTIYGGLGAWKFGKLRRSEVVFTNSPFQVVVGTGRERGALQNLTDLFSAEAEIIDCPDVGELYHSQMGITPTLCHLGGRTGGAALHLTGIGGALRHSGLGRFVTTVRV